MTQKENKLKSAIKSYFEGYKNEKIEIINVREVNIQTHKPEKYDESFIEEWNEATFDARIRYRQLCDYECFCEKECHIEYCSVEISYNRETKSFIVERIINRLQIL